MAPNDWDRRRLAQRHAPRVREDVLADGPVDPDAAAVGADLAGHLAALGDPHVAAVRTEVTVDGPADDDGTPGRREPVDRLALGYHDRPAGAGVGGRETGGQRQHQYDCEDHCQSAAHAGRPPGGQK